MTNKIDRREFIKTTAAGAVATGLSLRPTPASARIPGANDRIVAGFIGTGRMGESNLRDFVKQSDVEAAAVCDVYAPNLEKAAAMAPGAAKFTDFQATAGSERHRRCRCVDSRPLACASNGDGLPVG